MSILFDKLKELTAKKPDSPEPGTRPGLRTDADIYTFKRMIFSPRGMLLIFGTLIGFAILSFYTLVFIKQHLDDTSNRAIIVQRPNSFGSDPALGDPLADDPDSMIDDGITPGTNSSAQNTLKAPPFKVPQYFKALNPSDSSSQDPMEPDMDIPAEPSLPYHLGRKASLLKKKKPGVLKSIYQDAPSESVPQYSHLKPSEIINQAPMASVPNLKQTTTTQTILQLPQNTLPQNLAAGSEKKAQKLSQEKENTHRIRQTKTDEAARLASLSSRLENALMQNDTQLVNKLLEQVLKEKQFYQPYIFKLMAYREIENENYDTAKKWLNRVLSSQENDFEAGINMAIIEIRQQEFSKAKNRLLKLKELYPSQTSINDLLERL